MRYLFGLFVAVTVSSCGAEPAPSSNPGSDSLLTPRLLFIDENGAEVTQLRYGDPFSVRLVDLVPGAQVVVRSYLWGYEGEATFRVPESGTVDTAVDAPIEGTYQEVDPDGLVWSMGRVSDATASDLNVRFEAYVNGQQLDATLERAWLDEGLTASFVTSGGIVAQIFQPENAEALLPGLIVIGGSEGGLDAAAFQACWLAGYGYVAMGLAYFAESGLPVDLEEIPLEYFGDAIDALAATDGVDPTRIGIMGGSRGGEAVLMIGEHFANVSAVVAQVPSGVRWGAVSGNDASAWSWAGVPLPFVPDSGAMAKAEPLPGGKTGYRFTPTFEADLEAATPTELVDATIHVEDTKGAVLLLAGEDDGVWPSCELAQIAMDRLEAAGHRALYGDEYYCFEDAGHFVIEPGWPTGEFYAIDMGTFQLVTGGTPQGNARAQRDGLAIVKAFLAQHLKPD